MANPYTADNLWGLKDQTLWNPGDTSQVVAQRVLAAHTGEMTPEQKAEIEKVAGGQAYNPQAAAPAAPQAPSGPPSPTSGPAVQETVRNKWLEQVNQPLADANSPYIRNTADAYGAAIERQKRDYIDESAERLGPYATGAVQNEARLANERAGQAQAGFEADLVYRELQNQRQEIANALSGLQGAITEEQRQALQMKLAELDAALRREGYGVQSQLGNRELDIRDRLGTGDLNLRALLGLLSNGQFNKDLGFRIGSTEAQLNNDALRYWL